MHILATFQRPTYRNFSVPLTFSDGSTEVLDYNGNYVTGMSKVLLELDPSYRMGDWRLWFSGRYYSRQYASLVNNVKIITCFSLMSFANNYPLLIIN